MYFSQLTTKDLLLNEIYPVGDVINPTATVASPTPTPTSTGTPLVS